MKTKVRNMSNHTRTRKKSINPTKSNSKGVSLPPLPHLDDGWILDSRYGELVCATGIAGGIIYFGILEARYKNRPSIIRLVIPGYLYLGTKISVLDETIVLLTDLDPVQRLILLPVQVREHLGVF